jgi:hypothetical protein
MSFNQPTTFHSHTAANLLIGDTRSGGACHPQALPTRPPGNFCSKPRASDVAHANTEVSMAHSEVEAVERPSNCLMRSSRSWGAYCRR